MLPCSHSNSLSSPKTICLHSYLTSSHMPAGCPRPLYTVYIFTFILHTHTHTHCMLWDHNCTVARYTYIYCTCTDAVYITYPLWSDPLAYLYKVSVNNSLICLWMFVLDWLGTPKISLRNDKLNQWSFNNVCNYGLNNEASCTNFVFNLKLCALLHLSYCLSSSERRNIMDMLCLQDH